MSSLRDSGACLRLIPRTCVLGFSTPSLRDSGPQSALSQYCQIRFHSSTAWIARKPSNPRVQPQRGDTSLAPGERGEPQASQA